jgi:putative flippase GtrA
MTESLLDLPAAYSEEARISQRCSTRPASDPTMGAWMPAFAKFASVGTSGMVVDMAVFLASLAFATLGIARALGIGVAMTWNFVLNRQFTFAGCRRRPLWQQYLLFCASCLLGAIANWATSVALCHLWDWFMVHPAAAGMTGVAAGFAFNFVLSRRFVFPPSSPRALDQRVSMP